MIHGAYLNFAWYITVTMQQRDNVFIKMLLWYFLSRMWYVLAASQMIDTLCYGQTHFHCI